jgi:hypothetical protein
MKLVSSIISVIGLSLLAGCTIGNGHICGPQTPLAYCDRDAYERLVHPRGLGEYWEKPGMTKDSWKADWIDCGGRENGDFGPDEPIGPGDEAFQNAYKKKQSYLWSCMTKKGYQFTGKYWSFK